MIQDQPLDEIELVKNIVAGQTALYEVIIRRYNPYLYKVGRSYNYNHQDTEDLMQETFIAAYKGLKNFEGRSTFKTWIVRIMLNNCYHKTQKAQYKNEIIKDVNPNAKPMFANSNDNTDKKVQSNELKGIIETALADIPHKYRMVFSLREINGMNTQETANLLEIGEANVKVRLNRAKKMLRQSIEKSYAPNELFEFNLVYCEPMVKRVMHEINKL